MKIRLLPTTLISLAVALAGCVSTPGSASPWAIFASAGLTFGVDIAVPPVLDRNPTLAIPLTAVSQAITLSFGSGELTPANVSATVATLGGKYGLDASTQAVIAGAINKGVAAYSKAFGVKVASMTDPNVVEILNGIAAGLQQGVSDWQRARAPQPAILFSTTAIPAS